MAENDVPKHWETIVRAGAVSTPIVGKALGVIWEDSRKRRLSKLEQTMREIALETGIQALAERLETDPVIEALFADAMDTVMRTGLESKRRLLAKVVAQAVQDDSKIEEAALIAQALRDLDAPHTSERWSVFGTRRTPLNWQPSPKTNTLSPLRRLVKLRAMSPSR